MKPYLIIFFISIICYCFGCKKEHSCQDLKMKRNHSGICTNDCPGICGCDGKTYCNECDANKNGITIVSDSPCQ